MNPDPLIAGRAGCDQSIPGCRSMPAGKQQMIGGRTIIAQAVTVSIGDGLAGTVSRSAFSK
jgi:hypothetical protein